jgi:hypothetical protein
MVRRRVTDEPLSGGGGDVDASSPGIDDDDDDASLSLWVHAADVSRLFGRSTAWLEEQIERGRVRTRDVRGTMRHHRDDLAEAVRTETQGRAQSDALGAATRLALESGAHANRAMETLLSNNKELFNALLFQSDRQREYIKRLEDMNIAQREASEKALSEETMRKLVANEAEHKQAMKDRALSSFLKFAMPLFFGRIGKRWGVPMPPVDAPEGASAGSTGAGACAGSTKVPPASSANGHAAPSGGAGGDIPDAMKLALADGLMGWIATLKPDTLAKLRDVLPGEHFEMVASLHEKLGAT